MTRRSRWARWVINASADPQVPLPWARDPMAQHATFHSSRA